MANEQHLEWLKEGVEAWNARRKQDDFVPDLSGADLSGADFRGANLRSSNLSGANLSGANLSNTTLQRANLSGANLSGADFRTADLCSSKLSGANLSRANLSNTTLLLRANLTHANVQTEYSTADTNNVRSVKYTDLSKTRLNQVQLDSMIGDSGTIIPDHLTRPEHWPKFVVPDETDKSPNAQQDKIESKAETSDQVAYYQHLALKLVASPIKSSSVLTAYGSQLIEACRMYREFSSENDPPNDLILTENIGEQFLSLAKVIDQSIDTEKSDDKKYIEILEQRIKELEKMVHTLIADKQSAQPSAMQTIKTAYLKSVGVALGTGTVAALLGGVTYIFDPSWKGAIDLMEALSKFLRQPPPPLPPSMSV